MSKKKQTPKVVTPKAPKESPFFRPFEAVAKKRAEEAEQRAAEASKPKPKPVAMPKPIVDPGVSDAVAFEQLMYGVTPLGKKDNQRIPKTAATVAPTQPGKAFVEVRNTDDDAVRDHLRALVDKGADRFEVQDDGRRIEGRRDGVDTRLVRQLRRGELPVDARTDLHGMGAEEARLAVEAFVQKSRARGERTLLIIHGKGAHSPRGDGVLRGEIAAWLSQGKASHHVAAFVTALPEDGGEGALYVLLTR